MLATNMSSAEELAKVQKEEEKAEAGKKGKRTEKQAAAAGKPGATQHGAGPRFFKLLAGCHTAVVDLACCRC